MPRSPIADEGLADLFYFAKVICGFKDLSEKAHRPVCDQITERLVIEKAHCAIIIPRDHFKSSIGQATALWLFTRKALLEDNLEFRTLIDTSTLDLSSKHLGWLKAQMMGNERYRDAYGDFYGRGYNFNEREIYIKQRAAKRFHKEPNFKSSGIKAESVGLHFDFHWYDDLVSERNYGTKAMRQKTIDHYVATMQLLEPDGIILYTATRWHDGDLTGWLMKKERENEVLEDVGRQMTFYIRSSFDAEGEPIFPERWTKRRLLLKKSSITNFSWHSQWMNDPVQPEFSIPFDRATMYKPLRSFPEKLRLKVVTVDPAFTEESTSSGDYSAIIVGGFDRFNHWWGLDGRIGLYTASQLMEIFFEIYTTWRPDIFKIERKFTSWMDVALRRECMRRSINLPYTWIDRDNRSKEIRFQNLEPMFVRRQVTFAEEIDERFKQELEEELERVGVSAHDDVLDCLSDQFMHRAILTRDPNDEELYESSTFVDAPPEPKIPGMIQMIDLDVEEEEMN